MQHHNFISPINEGCLHNKFEISSINQGCQYWLCEVFPDFSPISLPYFRFYAN